MTNTFWPAWDYSAYVEYYMLTIPKNTREKYSLFEDIDVYVAFNPCSVPQKCLLHACDFVWEASLGYFLGTNLVQVLDNGTAERSTLHLQRVNTQAAEGFSYMNSCLASLLRKPTPCQFPVNVYARDVIRWGLLTSHGVLHEEKFSYAIKAGT